MPTDFIGLFAILACARILWSTAVVISIGGHETRVACVEHLIRIKEAAGRPQDLADVERLRARMEV